MLRIFSFLLIFFLAVSCENSLQSKIEQEPFYNLEIEKNEKNVLSCRLTFSTADKKKTFVKYHSPTHSGYKISEDSAKNDHYFFLWGMRENLDYTIEIYTDEEEPELLATTGFHSGILPESFNRPHLVTNDSEYVQPGFLMFSQQYSPDSENMEPIIFMVDTEGFIVWYYWHDSFGTAYLDDCDYIERTNTVFTGVHKYLNMQEIPAVEGIEIDLEGNIIWKSPEIAGSYYSETGWHHDYKLLDDDSILFLQSEYPDLYVVSDKIRNVDRDYNELWSWRYLDSPDYFSTVECSNPDNTWCDWTHTNSVMMFRKDNTVYFNSLWLGFFKMDMNTKEIVWKFGKDGDFTMLSEHQFPWPDSTHDPKFADKSRKRILFFDNGLTERFYSRIIEYEIDEETMTADITFEYDGIDSGRSWFAPGWGDADYLENGNILVTKGWIEGDQQNSSVFEITRDGRVVWELYTEQNSDFMAELYNAEKIIPPLEFLPSETNDSDTEKKPLFNLRVRENEKNSLSCRLYFSTPDKKKTFVKYYSATHSGYKISEDSAENDHYFFLWGMRENLDYIIEIYSDEEKPELLATTDFHSGIVPETVIKPYLVTNEKDSVQPGFVLISQLADPDTVEMPSVMFMVDTEGFVVWYFEHYLAGYTVPIDAEYNRDTKTVSAGILKGPNMADIPAEEGIEIDLEGNILWKSPAIAGYYYSTTSWHHDYKLLNDGTILFPIAVYDGSTVTDRIVNVDRNYNEIWSWSYLDSPDYFNDITCGNPDQDWCDWTHTNTVKMFKEDDTLYFNSLWLGFFKMDTTTKNIVWKFGKDGDFTMQSDHQFPWPDCTHDPKFADESRKRLLFFDNGMKERFYSRIIEYEIDEEAMTAEITFEYDGIDSGHGWFAGKGLGDADYLENGNFFVTEGWVDYDQNSSVFELTRDGNVVWELYTEQNNEYHVMLYNADKFVPPLEFLNL